MSHRKKQSTGSNRSVVPALVLAGVFLAGVAGLVVAGKLPLIMFALYFFASFVAFFAYGWDKSAARNERWRTAESTLQLIGLLGGWPGALVARHVFRHKSRKQSFIVAFWVTVALNCLALGWLLSPAAGSFLN